jgi:hypothetical protein
MDARQPLTGGVARSSLRCMQRRQFLGNVSAAS